MTDQLAYLAFAPIIFTTNIFFILTGYTSLTFPMTHTMNILPDAKITRLAYLMLSQRIS